MPHGAAIAPLEEEEEGKAKTGAELAKRERARTVRRPLSQIVGPVENHTIFFFCFSSSTLSLFHVKMGVLGEARGFAPDQGC